MMDELAIEEMSIRAVLEKMDVRVSALQCRERSMRAKNAPQRLSRRNRALESRGSCWVSRGKRKGLGGVGGRGLARPLAN